MADRATIQSGGTSNASDPEYPWAEPPAPAEICEVRPGVFWLRMPLPFALNHINLWLVEDVGGWTIVDTGIASDEVRELWRALHTGPMQRRAVTRLLVTHFHPDHFGLAGWLTTKHDAPLSMTLAEWLTGSMVYNDAEGLGAERQVDLCRANGLSPDWLERLSGRGNRYRGLVSPPPHSFNRLRDGDRFSIGANEWQVVVGTGHSPEHACLYCEAQSVLIAGDQVLPRITPNIGVWASEPNANPLRDYLDSLRRLMALPEDTLVLPSHGLPFYGLRPRLDYLRAHHEERLELLVEHCAKPTSAADLLPVLFRRELDAHQIIFAMGESLSHLACLREAGRLASHPDEQGIVRYVRT